MFIVFCLGGDHPTYVEKNKTSKGDLETIEEEIIAGNDYIEEMAVDTQHETSTTNERVEQQIINNGNGTPTEKQIADHLSLITEDLESANTDGSVTEKQVNKFNNLFKVFIFN